MNKLKNFVYNHGFLTSMILALFSFLICFSLNSFRISTSGDDYGLSLFIAQGDLKFFANCLLVFFLSPIQNIFQSINVFIAFQLLLNFISFITINWIFLSYRKDKFFVSVSFCLVFDILFSCFLFVHIQWTQTSAFVAISCYLLLYYSIVLYDKSRFKKVLLIIFGILLGICSSVLRLNAFFSVSVIFAAFVFSKIITTFLKNYDKYNKQVKKSIAYTINKWLSLSLAFIFILGSAFALDMASEKIKINIDGYNTYKEYTDLRSNVIDFEIASYEGNEDFYNSIGINSKNDLKAYKSWVLDNDFFNTDRLSKIVEYSSQNGSGKGIGLTIKNIMSSVIKKVSSVLPINPIISLFAIAVIGIASAILLFVFRNRLKYIFPIGLSLIWIAFFYVFRPRPENYLIAGLAVIIVLTTFVFNRYYFISASLISAALMALYAYIGITRPVFRATITFTASAIVFALLLCNDAEIRKPVISKKSNTELYLKKAIPALALLMSICLAFSLWNVEVKNKDNSQIYDYMTDNPDKGFVLGPGLGMSSCFNDGKTPLLYYKVPENVIINACWLEGSEYDIQAKERLNIEHTYRDLINNENFYYITTEYCKEFISEYYNDHYAEYNKTVEFILVDTIDNACVYKIVSE